MAELGMILLTVLIGLIAIALHAGRFVDFFRPSVLQIQLFGIHITLFGIVSAAAFDGGRGYGFAIGLIGLLTGALTPFSEPGTSRSDDK